MPIVLALRSKCGTCNEPFETGIALVHPASHEVKTFCPKCQLVIQEPLREIIDIEYGEELAAHKARVAAREKEQN